MIASVAGRLTGTGRRFETRRGDTDPQSAGEPNGRLSERLVELKRVLAAVPASVEPPAELRQAPAATSRDGALGRIFPLVVAARRACRDGGLR